MTTAPKRPPRRQEQLERLRIVREEQQAKRGLVVAVEAAPEPESAPQLSEDERVVQELNAIMARLGGYGMRMAPTFETGINLQAVVGLLIEKGVITADEVRHAANRLALETLRGEMQRVEEQRAQAARQPAVVDRPLIVPGRQ